MATLPAALLLLLNRRTVYRPVRAEYAAVAGLWPKQRFAVLALVKELTCVGRHGFQFGKATLWASQNEVKNGDTHIDRSLLSGEDEVSKSMVLAF
jgi:hypothetical protein